MAGLTQLFFLAAAFVTYSVHVESISVSLDDLAAQGPVEAENAVHDGQYLIVSSPSEHKVVWASLKNFKAHHGRAFALVDSGLDTPKGLAFDRNRGHLYIADSGAKKIFRYTVLTDTSGTAPRLTTSGVRLTITEGHPVEWVTIDHEGNLFYTAPDTNNINKIESDLLRQIAKGEVKPNLLQIVSQKTLIAQAKAKTALDKKNKASGNYSDLPTDAPPAKPQIQSIYESKLNPQVSQPACVAAHGDKLYWTNAKDGMTAGTVVRGKIHPERDVVDSNNTEKKGPKPFPAEALTKVSSAALGLAVSEKVIFFSRPNTETGNNSGIVSGLLQGSDIILDFVKTIVKPRGLVWDRDQTMYVADESGGNVWSFPTGRMMTDVPLTRAFQMKGAYGLSLLSDKDPCFQRNEVDSDGSLQAEQAVSSQMAGATPDAQQGAGQFLEKNGARNALALTTVTALAPTLLVTSLVTMA